MPTWTQHTVGTGIAGNTQAMLNASNPGGSNPTPCQFKVGSFLYYVTCAQIAFGSPSLNIFINKSSDGGVTWSNTYSGPEGFNSVFAAVPVGTKIYMFCNPTSAFTSALEVLIYDTTTDTFLAPGAASGVLLGGVSIFAGAYSTGEILVSYQDGGVSGWHCILYNPTSNTWSARVLIDASGTKNPVGMTIDTATDTAFLFAYYGGAGPFLVKCVPVSHPTTVGAIVTAFGFIANPVVPYQMGNICLSGGDVIAFYIDDPTSSPGPIIPFNLYCVRAPISTLLSFSGPELIDNTIRTPAELWTYTATFVSGWAGLDDGAGTLYAFFNGNANNLDNAASQNTLYFRTSTAPGVWSAKAAIWTGPVPSSALSIYPAMVAAGGIGIIQAFVDPVVAVTPAAYQALTVLFFAPVLPAPTLNIVLGLKGMKVYPEGLTHNRGY